MNQEVHNVFSGAEEEFKEVSFCREVPTRYFTCYFMNILFAGLVRFHMFSKSSEYILIASSDTGCWWILVVDQ